MPRTSKLLSLCALLSVGGCVPGMDVNAPGVLLPNTTGTIAPGKAALHRFTVAGAPTTIEYSVQRRSTGELDRWDVAVLAAAEFAAFNAGDSYKGLAKHEDVSTTVGLVTLEKAGEYAVALVCRNVKEDCRYTVEVTSGD